METKPSAGDMANLRERWLIGIFNEADIDHKGYISEKTAVRLIRSMNSRLPMSRIKLRVKVSSYQVVQ